MAVPLRVVHLTSAHPAFDVRIFVKECRSIAAQGFDVRLVVPHTGDQLVDGVRIHAVPPPSGRLDRMTRTSLRVVRQALRLKADVYHFHDPELIPAALFLTWAGHTVVYDVHEDAARALMSPSRSYLPRRIKPFVAWLFDRLERFAARRFHACVAATPAIAARLGAIGARTTTVNNFPLPGELAAPAQDHWASRPAAVAYIGVIAPGRGLREMTEAMGRVRGPAEVRLKLAGTFSSGADRERATTLAGWRHVDECGQVDRAAVASLLRQVRAGLVLFHPDPNHVEAQPNKLFEYMSAGLPVIASDFPLWRELIERERCGLLVDPLDVDAIARAIEFVVTHTEEAEAMGRRGRLAVERTYNWSSESRKLIALYQSLSESRTASPAAETRIV